MRCVARQFAPPWKDCTRGRDRPPPEVRLRLFFALLPGVDVATQLANLAAQIPVNDSGRLVSTKNFHLTVLFVGEIAAARLDTLRLIGQALRAACFTVVLDSMVFWSQPQAVVAAARLAPPGLSRLSSHLRNALALPETPFCPHVTLARKVVQAPVPPAMSPIVWHATDVALIRSDTGGKESAYTVLDTWPLLDETQNH